MRHSIRWQMMIFFVTLIAGMILIIWGINQNFLERYYMLNKQAEFKKVHQSLVEAIEDNTLSTLEFLAQISEDTEKGNIGIVVLDQSTAMLYTNENESQLLARRLMNYTFGQEYVQAENVLENTADYAIGIVNSMNTQTEYLEMWGSAGNGYLFLMQSPLENMRESVDISNTFLLYVGMCVTLLGAVSVWYLSKKFSRPILELAEVSKRMAALEFDVKYQGDEQSEIGTLGENFNLMSKKLEDTIVELKNANYTLRRDIERKDNMESARTEFIGNVSHELKTPLALIQGYAEGLKDNVNVNEESREFYCDVIMDEANKMNRLVRALLTLNQFEVGINDTQYERFQISELAEGVIQSCEILLKQKEVRIHFDTQEEVYVLADQFKTEQVLRNYIHNAIHHAEEKSVIDVKVTKGEDKVRVSIFNVGKPIPEEDIAHIWDKFYKVDKSHAREYGGNGLGLSIVKAIMTSFHQEYGVQNCENGVEFWFELDIQ